jgi:hypothetical protein
MLEEQKRKEKEAEIMNVLTIDVEKGEARLESENYDEIEFSNQNKQVNEFMQNQVKSK